MENATDALIMAASVLMLIIALTVSISSFSNLKSQVDDIITTSEQTDLAKDETGGYINYLKNSKDIRVVGSETLIASIRRVEKENYKIYIVTATGDDLGLETSRAVKQEYTNGSTTEILVNDGAEIIEISLSGKNNDVSKILNESFYNKVKNMKFKEYLGIYQNNTEASEENKETYRIITYVQQV